MKVEVLRVNGSIEPHYVDSRKAIQLIAALIGAEICDSVNLRDGRIMIVDDTGLIDGKPHNPQATSLYHSIYPRAKASNRPIVGDVAIAVDEDFA